MENKQKILAVAVIALLALTAIAAAAAYCCDSRDVNDTYTVTYDVPGTMVLGAPAAELTPVGEHFDYWLGSDSSTYHAGDTVVLTSDSPALTLTAVWAYNTYTIEFDANGGTGTMESMQCVYGTQYDLTANAYTLAGYSFVGWAAASDGAAVYDDGAEVSDLTAADGATVTLYAVWSANTYTITYDAGEGVGDSCTQSAVEDASVTLSDTAYTYANHAQVGWSDGTATMAMGATITYVYADDVTMTAVYECSAYAVTVDAGAYTSISAGSQAVYGTDFTFGAGTTFSNASGTSGTLVNVTVTVGGVEVAFTDNGDGTYTIDGDVITGDVIISTQDIVCYTVTYDINGSEYVYDYYSCDGTYTVTVLSVAEVTGRGHGQTWWGYGTYDLWWGWSDWTRSGQDMTVTGSAVLHLLGPQY